MRDTWAGEVVVTLAGDEESMGTRGTQFLLDHFEYSRGDAMITGDAGSPRGVAVRGKRHALARDRARGRAAHGAHVHLGVNAVERLIRALGEVFALREMPVHIPSDVDEVIRAASTVSEAISGNGETHTLRHVTVNAVSSAAARFQTSCLTRPTPRSISGFRPERRRQTWRRDPPESLLRTRA